jgi:GTP-binding protein
MNSYEPDHIRNVAIIAHIDHGKTTLLDSILRFAHAFREGLEVPDRVMDSNDQERERGITIFSKQTSIYFDGYKINIVDTPGHSDFSGEVERVLGMVNTVLLLVDAQEGPMPQTRYVLSKALKMGLKPIVVINKIDRPHADPDRILNETFDLFVELGAKDEQLDFSHVYGSGLTGFAVHNLEDERKDLRPLLEMIIGKVKPFENQIEKPFLMQVCNIYYNDYVGRQATGRVQAGRVRKGDRLARIDVKGQITEHAIIRVEGFLGLDRIELEEGVCGDIITLSGIPDAMIGDSLCQLGHLVQMPPIHLDEPAVSIQVMINSGPLVGKDGKNVTFNKIRERMEKEKKSNISLRIEDSSERNETITVAGRGELHLSVLLESMRREGFEMTVSKPQVILKEIEGKMHEPMERVFIEVPEEYSGAVIEELSSRKGQMQHMNTNQHSICELEFVISTRALMGYRNDFLTMTRGLGVLSTLSEGYAPMNSSPARRSRGVLISLNDGKVTGYALDALKDRGVLFVKPGDEVYEGMVVGLHSRENDLIVNVTRAKHLTNFRVSGSEDNVVLAPPRSFSLEQAIDFIEDDELVEITPKAIRLRKWQLKEMDRRRKAK